eukprot:scaffold347_cov380-Prasinococcus_capsulatus_cf.AAC.43
MPRRAAAPAQGRRRPHFAAGGGEVQGGHAIARREGLGGATEDAPRVHTASQPPTATPTRRCALPCHAPPSPGAGSCSARAPRPRTTRRRASPGRDRASERASPGVARSCRARLQARRARTRDRARGVAASWAEGGEFGGGGGATAPPNEPRCPLKGPSDADDDADDEACCRKGRPPARGVDRGRADATLARPRPRKSNHRASKRARTGGSRRMRGGGRVAARSPSSHPALVRPLPHDYKPARPRRAGATRGRS